MTWETYTMKKKTKNKKIENAIEHVCGRTIINFIPIEKHHNGKLKMQRFLSKCEQIVKLSMSSRVFECPCGMIWTYKPTIDTKERKRAGLVGKDWLVNSRLRKAREID